MSMRRLLLMCVIALFLSSDANAGRPGWFFPKHGGSNAFQSLRNRQAPSYAETYHRLHARYPRYIGAFHSSYFRDIGVPPGDIGLRGNGLLAYPW